MDNESKIVAVGDTVVFTAGCYSDYGIAAIYTCIEEFNYRAEFSEWCELVDAIVVDGVCVRYNREKPYFYDYLKALGKIKELKAKEIHLGEYSEVNPVMTDIEGE